MNEQYIMALDQGTTSSRRCIFDRLGRIRSMAQRGLRQIYPKPGWVEQNPVEIWATQAGAAAEALAMDGLTHADIAAAGIASQRETTILWNRETGTPVANAVVWQCRLGGLLPGT